MKKQTTKQCWNCGCKRLRLYASKRMKQCDECQSIMPWELDEGQSPTVGSSRDKDTGETK